MLTKTDLKEIEKLLNSHEKSINKNTNEKIDNLAIVTKKQFDEVYKKFEKINKRFSFIESNTKSMKRTQLSHETRLVNLEV